jgi:hypothetical protein
MEDYITKEDTIVFSPYFNEPINNDLLTSYNKIIFSNYELNESLFEKYLNDDFNGLIRIFSKFNQEVKLPDNLTHLTFGSCFNQEVKLPDNLTHLTFGYYFNQEVKLPDNLTHLTFGYYFNQ